MHQQATILLPNQRFQAQSLKQIPKAAPSKAKAKARRQKHQMLPQIRRPRARKERAKRVKEKVRKENWAVLGWLAQESAATVIAVTTATLMTHRKRQKNTFATEPRKKRQRALQNPPQPQKLKAAQSASSWL
jgi:hypothetical protein